MSATVVTEGDVAAHVAAERPRAAAGSASPRRVLFSTPTGPYEPHYFNTSLTDVWNQRFSRGCGVFTVSGHIHTHFAHVLAQNISLPSVFLEYPTERNFIDELKRGYAVIGLSGFHHQIDAVIRMCKLCREHAPESTVVVGAWAAMGIAAVYPESTWRVWADHLCLGEGIRFMRELLGEDPSAPVSITHLPKGAYTFPWLDPHLPGNIGAIVASLGCPRGCDFCGPTTMLRRRQPLLTPRQVVQELDRQWREDPMLVACNVYEEDSFQDKDYLMEVGRLIREETEAGLSRINLFILGSVGGLEQWDLDEVALCGVSTVFIGVESKFAPESGYKKRCGRPVEEVFRELHRRGIATIGGWMAGFDFQTRETMEEDLEHFISLQPTMQQLTRLCPFPGTELWRRLSEEGRIPREPAEWESVSFFGGGGLKPLHFENHEVMEIIDRGYRKLYETWGACFARLMEVNLNGYEYCREHQNPYLRFDRSRLHRRVSARAFPFLRAMEVFAPNGAVRQRMQKLQRRYVRLFGPPTLTQRGLERLYLKRVSDQKRRLLLHPEAVYAKAEPCKRYEYTLAEPAGAYPYRVSHPNRDLRFEVHRRVREVLTRGLSFTSRVLNGFEGLHRELEPELRECLPIFV